MNRHDCQRTAVTALCALLAAMISTTAVIGETVELLDFPEFTAPRTVASRSHDHFFVNDFAINAWSPDGCCALVLETSIKDSLPAGKMIGFNSVHEGTRQVYVMDVGKMK